MLDGLSALVLQDYIAGPNTGPDVFHIKALRAANPSGKPFSTEKADWESTGLLNR
jgi:hypothetical protein